MPQVEETRPESHLCWRRAKTGVVPVAEDVKEAMRAVSDGSTEEGNQLIVAN